MSQDVWDSVLIEWFVSRLQQVFEDVFELADDHQRKIVIVAAGGNVVTVHSDQRVLYLYDALYTSNYSPSDTYPHLMA